MTTTHAMAQCPSCERPLAPDAPDGLCPKCLINGALQSGLGNSLTDSRPQTTMSIPDVAEVAALLPHLDVVEELGRGGMGVVYLARQPGLDRPVAVKLLPREIGADPSFAERFAREARSLAKLSHPNIVAVHDSGTAGEFCYFIMEDVDGSNLRGLLTTGALTPGEALELVPQICAGLQYAHETGIVHRDINPQNILVTEDGRVKIADFGLAKLLGPDSRDATLTLTNQVMGTPHYMAPEQLRRGSGSVDRRADIYALGVVLYELLTGQLPIGRFAAPSRVASTDPALDGVVLRCLESNPERRFQEVKDVQRALESGEQVQLPVHAAVTEVIPRSPEEEREAVLQLLEGEPSGDWRLIHYLAAVPTLGLASALRAEAILQRHLEENALTLPPTADGGEARRERFRLGALEHSRQSARRRSRWIVGWFVLCVLVALAGPIGTANNPEPKYRTRTETYQQYQTYFVIENNRRVKKYRQQPMSRTHQEYNYRHRNWQDKMLGVSVGAGVLWILGLLLVQLLHWNALRRHERAQLSVEILDRELTAKRTEAVLDVHKHRWRLQGWIDVLLTAVALIVSLITFGAALLVWLAGSYHLALLLHTKQEEAGLTALTTVTPARVTKP